MFTAVKHFYKLKDIITDVADRYKIDLLHSNLTCEELGFECDLRFTRGVILTITYILLQLRKKKTLTLLHTLR